jgi:hypothetical protein
MPHDAPELERIRERLASSRAELRTILESRPELEAGDEPFLSVLSGEFPRSATLRLLRNIPDHPLLTSVAMSTLGLLASRMGFARLTKIIGVIALLRRLRDGK